MTKIFNTAYSSTVEAVYATGKYLNDNREEIGEYAKIASRFAWTALVVASFLPKKR